MLAAPVGMAVTPELVVLVGLPGAGKSTFYEQRLAQTHGRVSKDLLRARDKQREQLRRIGAALARGESVVADNLNVRRQDRAPLVACARAHGARALAYWFDEPAVACRDRNRLRQGRSRVADAVVFITAHRLEVPAAGEGFDELWRVRVAPGSGFALEPLAGAP